MTMIIFKIKFILYLLPYLPLNGNYQTHFHQFFDLKCTNIPGITLPWFLWNLLGKECNCILINILNNYSREYERLFVSDSADYICDKIIPILVAIFADEWKLSDSLASVFFIKNFKKYTGYYFEIRVIKLIMEKNMIVF